VPGRTIRNWVYSVCTAVVSLAASTTVWVSCVSQGPDLRLALVEGGERPCVRWLHSEGPRPTGSSQMRRAWRALPRGRWPAVALLERGRYQVLQAEKPDLPPQEWRDALRWRLKEQVDFAVDGAAIDLLEMPSQAGPRHQRNLMVFAAPAAERASLRQAGEDAGWSWEAVDVAETALRNLSRMLASPGRGHALLHLGSTHATLVVTVAGSLLLSRQIDVTREQLTAPDGDTGTRTQAMERAGLELQRTLDGFDRVFSQVGLERLDVLPGPGADEFADHARELLYVPVLVADMAARLDLSPLAPDTGLADHWLAIGAALRQPLGTQDAEAPADLNLDPAALRPSVPTWAARQGLWAAGGALAGAWLLGAGLNVWAQQRQADALALSQQLPQQRAQLEARDPGGADTIQRLVAERQRLQALEAMQRRVKTQVDEHLQRSATGYTPYFRALSRQSQPSVWITGFSVTAAGSAIEIQGRMSDAALLPGYLAHLNQEPSFKGRQFGRLQLAQGEGHTAFTLGGAGPDNPGGTR